MSPFLAQAGSRAAGIAALAAAGRICDSIVPLPFKVVLMIALLVLHNSGGVPYYLIVLDLVVTATVFLVARLLPISAFFTIYWSIHIFEDLVVTSFSKYVTYDGPVGDIANEWRTNILFAGSYSLTAAVLTEPKLISRYLIPSIRSTCITVLFTLTCALLWRHKWRGKIVDSLFKIWDAVNYLDGRRTKLIALLLHQTKFSIRHLCENIHHKIINFESIGLFSYDEDTQALLQDNQIRVLHLPRRSFFSGTIDARLETIALEPRSVQYEALSYRCGPKFPQRGILVNGRRFYVGLNLHGLLHARSSLWRARCVWVDAICISQENLQEKSAQVQKMTEIYQKAFRVVAWLGDGYDTAMAAYMVDHIHTTILIFDHAPIDLFNNYRWGRHRPEWQAFIKLVRNAYFSRAWICQEVTLGEKLLFLVGNQYIHWQVIFTAIAAVGQPEVRSLFATDGITHANDEEYYSSIIMMFGLRIQSDRSHSLGLLMSVFARLQSTLVVDKIFALRGLANTDLSRAITPDYVRDEREVLIDVATALYRSREDADYLLPHAGIVDRPNPLPSWVPDWKYQSEKRSEILSTHNLPSLWSIENGVFGTDSSTAKLKYAASGSTTSSFTVNRATNTLLLRALFVGTVNRVSGLFRTDVQPQFLQQEYIRWINIAQTLVDTVVDSHGGGTGQPRSGVLWRTLIADRSQDERPAPVEYERSYDLWHHYLFHARFPTADDADEDQLDPYELLKAVFLYHSRFLEACRDRQFALTGDGEMTLVPARARDGDLLCLVLGMQTPFVLRPVCGVGKSGAQMYQLVGECFVYGMMDGECMNEDAAETIEIV